MINLICLIGRRTGELIRFSNIKTSTLSWRRSLSYRNQFIELQSKSMDWFLYDSNLRHEKVRAYLTPFFTTAA